MGVDAINVDPINVDPINVDPPNGKPDIECNARQGNRVKQE